MFTSVSKFVFGDEGSDYEFEELECRRLFVCTVHTVSIVLAFEFVGVVVFEIVIGGTVLFVLILILLLGLFGCELFMVISIEN